MTDEVPEFQQYSITGSTANSWVLVMLLGSKSVPRSNGIPCLRRDRSGLTRVLDKSEATCIRQVEGYVLEVDVNEIGRSSSGNRAATQRHSILGMRTPPNTYLSSQLRVVLPRGGGS